MNSLFVVLERKLGSYTETLLIGWRGVGIEKFGGDSASVLGFVKSDTLNAWTIDAVMASSMKY